MNVRSLLVKKLTDVAGLLILLLVPLVAEAQSLRPDLVISGNVAVSTTRVGVGETYDYFVTVKNNGGAPCNRVKFFFLTSPGPGSDFLRGVGESPLMCGPGLCEGGPFFLLWPGQSISARFLFKARDVGLQGPATVVVDPDNVCKEASETNNTATSPQVQIIERPRLNVVVHAPVGASSSSPGGGIQPPKQIFPVTITNVGRGVATDVAISWLTGTPPSPPRLISAYLGPRVASGSPAPPPLNIRCPPMSDPTTTVCIVEARLGPNESIQGSVEFASCRQGRVNAAIHVATADDTATAMADHSVSLHAGCR